MKHLKLLNILIVMLLLTAFAPAPVVPAAAPVAPVLNAPANGLLVTSLRPEFSWKQPTYDRTSYNLEISFDSYFKNTAKRIALVSVPDVLDNGLIRYTPTTDLPSNSKIFWRVQAVTPTGNSSWSAVGRYIKTAPYPMSGIIGPIGDILTLRPTLSWHTTNDSDGVLRTNKFDIQVIKKDGGATVKTALVTGDSYLFTTDLLRETTYQWRVRSHGLFANSEYTPYQDFVTPNPPSVPVLVAPASVYVIPPSTNPVFDWKDATTTSGKTFTYTLQLSTSAKFDTNVTNIPDIGPSTYTLTSVLDTGTYYWRVAAVDSDGAMSNWSLARTIKTQPSLKIIVQDFLTKDGIPGATVTITGITDLQTSNGEGMVEIPTLTPGTKYVTAVKEDYVTKKVAVSVAAGAAKELVVELVHVPMYVKLYWTDKYQNLDLHLWIPEDFTFGADDEGGHIMADHKGTTTAKPYAKLSGDVVKGSATAVETITIQNRYPGKYVIGVYNYYKSSFFGSGAMVKVYMGKVLMDTITVPAVEGSTQIWWHVADITTGGVLDPVSQLVTDSPGPYDPDGGTFAIPGR